MFLLTREQGNIESGVFATMDDDGTAIVQFFVSKDDAIMYNTMLEAIDQEINVTEVDDEMVDKFCGALGHAYSVVADGEMVIPKLETLHHVMLDDDSL